MVMHTLQVSCSGLNALVELLEIEKLKINSRMVVLNERNSFWLQLSSSASYNNLFLQQVFGTAVVFALGHCSDP